MTPQELSAIPLGDISKQSKAVQQYLAAHDSALSLGSGGGSSFGGTAGSNTPGVPSTQAGDIINFAMPNQLSDLTIPSTAPKQTGTNGTVQMTYAQAVQLLHDYQGTPELDKIQQMLHNAGYLKGTKIPYGTLDKSTLDAWKQALLDTYNANQSLGNINGQPVTVMTLLAGGGPQFVSEITAVETKYQAAMNAAATASAPMLTMQDPNQIAQAFASAMESIGAGAPSKQQVAHFVTAFQTAEKSAVQDAYATQKGDYLSEASQLQNQLQGLTNGQYTTQTVPGQPIPEPLGHPPPAGAPPVGPPTQVTVPNPNAFNPALGVGPTTVATKAMPNLDAEAMAAAKNSNPGQYYASQVSYYGNIIHDMLDGNLTGQSAPIAPSQSAPAGAILTSPVGGI
ncbi:MAG: hypothetical protein KGI71_05235 [Patescibacteria group bacterium]|nr:hypothetical protein [Patescibacteria group bacterium]